MAADPQYSPAKPRFRRIAYVLAVVAAVASPSSAAAREDPLPSVEVRPDRKHDAEGFAFSFSFGGGRLGVVVAAMTSELRAFFGAPKDAGILVSRVESESAAERAGLKVGDVIVEVAGRSIADVGDVFAALGAHRKGDAVDVVVVRRKRRVRRKVILERDMTTAMRRARFGPSATRARRRNARGGRDQLERELQRVQRELERVERRLRELAVPPRN